MQQLTAAPRDSFTEAQIKALLTTAPDLTVDGGLDLLDNSDQFVRVIDGYQLAGSSVDRDDTSGTEDETGTGDGTGDSNAVQGTCTLNLTETLQWGTARVRPWMSLTGDDGTGQIITARWNLGVYVLTTPTRVVGQVDGDGNPIDVYQVTGYDKNYLLQNPICDTRSYPIGTDVLDTVEALIVESGAGGGIALDGTAAGSLLQVSKTFTFSDSEQDTYLTVINQLLAMISYRPLWVDENGIFRSEPAVTLAAAPVEWQHTADDQLSTQIGVQRQLANDLWGAPNWWIFTNTSMPGISDGQGGLVPSIPSLGNGIYKFENLTDGPSSQQQLGRVVKKSYFIDAVDEAALEAAAAVQIAEDQAATWTVETTISVFPGAGHLDVADLTDTKLGGLFKIQQTKWSLPLDGGDMSVTWQGNG